MSSVISAAVALHVAARSLSPRMSASFAASLPNPLVGFSPDRRRALGLRLDDRPKPPRQPVAASHVQQDRVQHGAKHVVLALIERPVPDPHRSRTGIAG